MSSLLVLIESNSDGTGVSSGSLAAISAALKLKNIWSCSSVVGLVYGQNTAPVANDASTRGMDKVITAEGASIDSEPSELSALIKACLDKEAASVFIASASSTGKDVAPRVAVALGAGQASDVIAILDDGGLERPMYAGDVIATVELVTEKKVVTTRASSFEPAIQGTATCPVEPFTSIPTLADGEAVTVISRDSAKGDRPELGDARVVVSGGRALKDKDTFESIMFPLADALGAAVGASRAAVDSGFCPNDWQVGQTGKVVAPELYIAVGISGAIQHVAGMKDSKVIVAINKDPEAPIAEIADYYLVGDLYEIVPEFMKLVAQG